MKSQEIHQVILRVIEALERLDVPYQIAGSVASSMHGIARLTVDADLVADLRPEQARALAELLGQDFYYSVEAMEAAVRAKRSFNVIDLGTMLKVDVFSVKNTPFARVEFSRKVQKPLADSGRLVWVSSPEDIILHKLTWYAAGGKVADRQWNDVIGVLRIQQGKLDQRYLAIWADSLGVSDLLSKAMEESK